jgi:hypothetical protein
LSDEELTEDGNRIVDLEPSSPVDPRAQLPADERQTESRTLPNGTVLTSYTEPPMTADEYHDSMRSFDEDAYEALVEEVIAEATDNERARIDLEARASKAWPYRGDWDPAPINRLGIWARKNKEAEEAAKAATEDPQGDPEGDPWERLDDVR